jgi:hypothetical protein
VSSYALQALRHDGLIRGASWLTPSVSRWPRNRRPLCEPRGWPFGSIAPLPWRPLRHCTENPLELGALRLLKSLGDLGRFVCTNNLMFSVLLPPIVWRRSTDASFAAVWPQADGQGNCSVGGGGTKIRGWPSRRKVLSKLFQNSETHISASDLFYDAPVCQSTEA